LIEVSGISRDYVRARKRKGPWGTLKDLLKPQLQTVHAVTDVSLSVRAGECIGLVGPNGAGKSTLLKILSAVLTPDKGTVRIGGVSPTGNRYAYLRQIGVVFGHRSRLVWDLPVTEVMDMFRVLYDIPRSRYLERVALLSHLFELDQISDLPVRSLSLGQKMRCEIAVSLLHAPKVLLLDEPTLGLDAKARYSLRLMLKQVKSAEDACIIVSSHDLYDIEQLSDRLIVMDRGRVAFEGAPQALLSSFGDGLRVRAVVENRGSTPLVLPLPVEWLSPVELRAKAKDSRELGRFLGDLASQVKILDAGIQPPSLEDALIQIYNSGTPAK
jgi:ABC-2 type transport system ATP-binding protein